MRIVLISGIVSVHMPFDTYTSPFKGAYGFFDWLRAFLRDSLFRVGVPCLSAISGYLLFPHGTASPDDAKIIRRKTKTVILPSLVWNRSGSDLCPAFYRLAAALALFMLPFTNGMARNALPSLHNLLTGSRARPRAGIPAVQSRIAEDRRLRCEQR